VGPGDGATAVLDGSHKLDGNYASLKGRCELLLPSAPAGSIFLFTETLVHTPVPIVTERTRHAMFYSFGPPWLATWVPGQETPPQVVASVADENLRELLGPPHYRGQWADDPERLGG
jgi:hypothetical protein